MKTSMKILITLFIVSTLAACAQLTKHVDTIKPTAKLTGATITNITFDKVDLVFDLAVENKNPISLSLAGLEYDFKIENQSLVSGVTAKAIKLKANTVSPVQLPVTLKFADLKKLPGELWNKDKLSYDLQTTFNITLPIIGNYAVPVSKQGELPVPKMPGIKIKNVEVKKLGFTSAELVAKVEIDNPNDFDLVLKNLDYQLKINQKKWGQGEITKSSSIPRKAKGIIEIPITLDLFSMGGAAVALLQKKAPIEYQLTGSATLNTGLTLLKEYKLPLDIKGTTTLR